MPDLECFFYLKLPRNASTLHSSKDFGFALIYSIQEATFMADKRKEKQLALTVAHCLKGVTKDGFCDLKSSRKKSLPGKKSLLKRNLFSKEISPQKKSLLKRNSLKGRNLLERKKIFPKREIYM